VSAFRSECSRVWNGTPFHSAAKWEGVYPMPRDLAILACTECKRRNYTTTRNKKTMTERVELKKYCPNERRHTVHKEVK
jgi:large subunit ribosomal protein L33